MFLSWTHFCDSGKLDSSRENGANIVDMVSISDVLFMKSVIELQ